MLALPALASAEGSVPLRDVLDPLFFQSELWDDGKAEVALYRGTRTRDGLRFEHEQAIITQAETLNREFHAKADWPHGQKPLLPVIKQNQVIYLTGGAQPVHLMSSLFLPRSQGDRAVRLTFTASDWTAITTKEIQRWKPRVEMVYQSSRDGEGSGSRPLPDGRTAYFEEELLLMLRALQFREKLTAGFVLYPSQLTFGAEVPKGSAAQLVARRDGGAWLVSIEALDNRTIDLWFEAAHPHPLWRMEHSDGRTLERTALSRQAYWHPSP
jgi:hypothetical protein